MVKAERWFEIQCDAGNAPDDPYYHGAFTVRRHILGEEKPEDFAAEAGRMDRHLPGPTPAEGVALLFGLKWACRARDSGEIFPDDPVVLFTDNMPVALKVEKGTTWGTHMEIWCALKEAKEELQKRGPVEVLPMPRHWNLADALTHENYPELSTWKVPEE